MLAGLGMSNNTSTYIFRDKLTTEKNAQNTFFWSTYTCADGLPTVDPGTGSANFVRKIYWDQTGNATGQTTRPVLHLQCNNQWTFRSCSETPIVLTVHHIIARKDHNVDPLDLWRNGLTDTYKQFLDCYATTSAARTSLGVTPFMSTPFCQHFKIIGTRRVTLGPGETHQMYVKQKAMKMVDGQYLKNSTAKYRAGFTYALMFTIRGVLANDAEGDVGVPGVKINYEVKQMYKWKLVNELNRDQFYYFDNSALTSALGPLREINPETGQMDTTLDTS